MCSIWLKHRTEHQSIWRISTYHSPPIDTFDIGTGKICIIHIVSIEISTLKITALKGCSTQIRPIKRSTTAICIIPILAPVKIDPHNLEPLIFAPVKSACDRFRPSGNSRPLKSMPLRLLHQLEPVIGIEACIPTNFLMIAMVNRHSSRVAPQSPHWSMWCWKNLIRIQGRIVKARSLVKYASEKSDVVQDGTFQI